MVTTRCILAVLILLPALASYAQPVKLGAIPTTNVVHGSNLFLMQQSATASGVARLMTVSNFFQNVPTNQAIHRSGGNARGLGAIDFQNTRGQADQVASGLESFIGPGSSWGKVTGARGVILTGSTAGSDGNQVTNSHGVILSGTANTNGGQHTVMSGSRNADIGGTGNNFITGTVNKFQGATAGGDSVIAGGSNNEANNCNDIFIAGAIGAIIDGSVESGTYSASGATITNCDNAVAVGGSENKIWSSDHSIAAGGMRNHVTNAPGSFAIGSSNRVAAANAGAIGVGNTNTTPLTLDLGMTNGTKMTITRDWVQFRGGIVLKNTQQPGAYTISTNDHIIEADSALFATPFTVTLPQLSRTPNGFTVTIKDVGGVAGTHNITVDGDGSEQIDGGANYLLNVNYESVTLMKSDYAVKWVVIGAYP